MKTLVYVIPVYPVLSETFIPNEIRAMVDRGHQVVPVALESGQGQAQGDEPPALSLPGVPRWQAGLQVWRLLRPKALKFLAAQKGLPRMSLTLSACRLAVLARQAKGDHLHCHFAQHSAAIGILTAAMLGKSVSFVGHGADVYRAPSDLPLKLATASFSVAVCRDMANDFARLGSAATHTIPCGIPTQRFVPCSVASVSAPGRFLAIGRLVEKKGFDFLLRVLSAFPESQRPILDIVGHGPERQALETLISQAGLDPWVNLLGPQPLRFFKANHGRYRALLAPFRIACDGDRDTGPLVIKEAMALGLPVVVSNIMGLKEIVSRQTGWQCPPDDLYAWRRALRQVMQSDAERLDAMGVRARARVHRHFDVAIQARKLSSLVEAC
ncbi:glycosyltransferase family 4 protein [Marinobacter hydrocarbonoclasticus]|nr:glycosyltransferase family 4 protein [Marinobacter nauticus]